MRSRARCATSATSPSSRRRPKRARSATRLTLRHVRCGSSRIDDRVFSVDGTPTDCVNVAVTHVFNGLARSRRLRHQQGLEPWRRCDVFGDGGGRARGALLGMPAIAVSLRQTRGDYDFGVRGARRRTLAEAMLRQPAAGAHVSQHQRAERAAEGLSCHRAGEAEPRDVGRRAARSERAAVLLD